MNRLVVIGSVIADQLMTVPRLPDRGGDVLAGPVATQAGGAFNIAAAAVRLGLDSFTMQGLAEDLGVSPATLYSHVAGRDEVSSVWGVAQPHSSVTSGSVAPAMAIQISVRVAPPRSRPQPLQCRRMA